MIFIHVSTGIYILAVLKKKIKTEEWGKTNKKEEKRKKGEKKGGKKGGGFWVAIIYIPVLIFKQPFVVGPLLKWWTCARN